MFRKTVLLALGLIPLFVSAQRLYFEYGKIRSSFEYFNSQKEKLEGLHHGTNNHLSVGFSNHIGESSFYYLGDVSYSKYTAVGSDELLGNYYDWNVDFVGLNLGVGYEFMYGGSFASYKEAKRYLYKQEGFSFHVQVEAGSEFLATGRQLTNYRVYNLRRVEQFEKPFIFARGAAGITYNINNLFAVHIDYVGGRSFTVFEPTVGGEEELNFITHSVVMGLDIRLFNRKK